MEYTCNHNTLPPPSERFCLLDLDENETHLKTLRVVMNDLNTEDFVEGLLHLNSRSLIFDAHNQALPLIKIRYNSNFEFECMSHEQISTIFNANSMNKSSFSNPDNSSMIYKGDDPKLSKISHRKKTSTAIQGRKRKHSKAGECINSH